MIDPPKILGVFKEVSKQNLCPNRIWQVGSRLEDWPTRLLAMWYAFGDKAPLKNAMRHEDHSACNFEFCEFSSRNFTAVQQYHEPRAYEEGDQANVASMHDSRRRHVCFPLRGRFSDRKLIEALGPDPKKPSLTPWTLDGLTILETPRPFMAISHVWSDGTGTGTWNSKQVNECLFNYFTGIAKQFDCEGIWWDTLCMPQDRRARSKVLNTMHYNYEFARVTLVHDRFLRNLPFESPEKACFAVITSSWFSRGWTALELAKSRKVKVIFLDCIKDLDVDILDKVRTKNIRGTGVNAAAEIITQLRRSRISNIEDILVTLGPRYTSWTKDRATIAGLLAGITVPDIDNDTFQRHIYQSIVKRRKQMSYDYLFHNRGTMSKGFSWCATNLFHLPQGTTQQSLQVNRTGELIGDWTALPADQIDEAECSWGKAHRLIEEQLRYALQKSESKKHLLLVPPEAAGVRDKKRGILVKLLRRPSKRFLPGLKCQFVGSLYFKHPLESERFKEVRLNIGDTDSWKQLHEDENAWDVMRKSRSLRPFEDFRRYPKSYELIPGWQELHQAAWVDHASILKRNKAVADGCNKPDELGRQAIHLASERGHAAFVKRLLGEDSRKDPSHQVLKHGDFNRHGPRDLQGRTALHYAAWGGSLKTVKLLKHQASAIDKDDNTALHVAAAMGCEDVVKFLCERTPIDFEAPGRYGLTPLHYAAINGHYEAAKVLVEHGATVDKKDTRFGWTPLHYAADHGGTRMVQLLLEEHASVDEADEKVKWTPLHVAAMNGHREVVIMLKEGGANLLKEDSLGTTALDFAVINMHEAVMRYLDKQAPVLEDSRAFVEDMPRRANSIPHNSNFEDMIFSSKWSRLYLAAMDGQRRTLHGLVDDDTETIEGMVEKGSWLHHAARNGQIWADHFLLSSRTNLEAKAKDGCTPLWWAIRYKQATAVQALVELGAQLETKDSNGRPLFIDVASRGEEPFTRLLAGLGAHTDTTDDDGRTALMEAAAKGHEATVRFLLDPDTGRKANVEAKDNDGRTALIAAACSAEMATVRLLLVLGKANVENTSKDGRTALIWAAMLGHNAVVQLLLDPEIGKKANVEAKDNDGRTALIEAAASTKPATVLFLLQTGKANVDAQSNSGETALIEASLVGHKATVQVLLDKGEANFDLKDNQGWTALKRAAARGYEAIVRLLLAIGADVNVEDKNNRTALMEAAASGYEATVWLLLSTGKANVEVQDNMGRTALTEAEHFEHEPIVLLLKNYPAAPAVSAIRFLAECWGGEIAH